MENSQKTQGAAAQSQGASLFQPRDLSDKPTIFSLPGEIWTSMLETACSYEPEYFQRVMMNLIKHPEISSTYLFRAEIFYDSFNDPEAKFVKHIKAEYRPMPCQVPGYNLQQTIVRRMIPRNPQRDNPLVQTCHIFKSKENSGAENNLIIYIPHVQSAEEVPFYHPTVAALAFLHTWPVQSDASRQNGVFSIHYRLFQSHPLDNRLTRTALSLLTLINKHCLGQKSGYTKRVHHDQVIPQARFQDTYTRLKTKYAKDLIAGWVEQTPPGKHVFEDLGIAAFLLELWNDMYVVGDNTNESVERNGNAESVTKPPFPGFVDIGCGNGVLVYVLRQEGYHGWGFDARKRKTWETFPVSVQENLKEMVLVPEIFTRSIAEASENDNGTDNDATTTAALIADLNLRNSKEADKEPKFHSGIFPRGIFIISNHADELTPWTPLLAYLSASPFIAIPCCSHNFAGAKFRAPMQKDKSSRSSNGNAAAAAVLSPSETAKSGGGDEDTAECGGTAGKSSGSLQKKPEKQPSAYATLCDWVVRLAEDVGFAPEKEMLRIPSTRNVGIVGKTSRDVGRTGGAKVHDVGMASDKRDMKEKLEVVRRLLVTEMGGNADAVGGLETVAKEWVDRAGKLVKGQGGGH